jgi:hypothetical protein
MNVMARYSSGPDFKERKETMLRLISLLALAAALAVAFLVPGSASADLVNGCPPGFLRITTEEAFFLGPFVGPADRNGDTFVCFKVTPSGQAIAIDNNVPSGTAPGSTDSGSTVLVDTNTGDVLGG